MVTKLPSMEHTFTISVKGSETGKIFDGTFTYVRPTLGTRVEISKMEAKLREDLATLPIDVNAYVDMIATLRHTLKDAPTWWKESKYGLDLYDINVINEIYKAVEKFEEEWEKSVYKKDE
jgi:hypothetical protein